MIWNEHNVACIPGDGLEIRYQFSISQQKGTWVKGLRRYYADGQWTAYFRKLDRPVIDLVRECALPPSEEIGLYDIDLGARLSCEWKLFDLGGRLQPSSPRPASTCYRSEILEEFEDAEIEEEEC